MSVNLDFEADCAFTAMSISSLLTLGKCYFTISLEGVNKKLFEDIFVKSIASLLGGIVDGNYIYIGSKMLSLSFKFWEVIDGFIKNLNIIIVVSDVSI
jgi:hypothetical protein